MQVPAEDDESKCWNPETPCCILHLLRTLNQKNIWKQLVANCHVDWKWQQGINTATGSILSMLLASGESTSHGQSWKTKYTTMCKHCWSHSWYFVQASRVSSLGHRISSKSKIKIRECRKASVWWCNPISPLIFIDCRGLSQIKQGLQRASRHAHLCRDQQIQNSQFSITPHNL